MLEKISLDQIDAIGCAIDETEILVYLSHLINADYYTKIIKDNEFQYTCKNAQDYINDLLLKNLMRLKNAYSDL